uniref:Uncharacterized protein n=1 Tax=viral metagenome TaxID=1070528 RepID=A0A6C0JDU1_9ZZZZ
MASFDFYLQHLYSDDITVGALRMPNTDGVAGDFIQTDGAGILSVVTPSFTAGPAGPVTDEALTVFDGTTGKLFKESAATCDVAGNATLTSLVAGGLTYPVADGSTGSALVTDGSGNLSFSATQVTSLFGDVSASYTSDLVAGDHLKFDSIAFSSGTNVVLDVATAYTSVANVASLGRVTVKTGPSYCLVGKLLQYQLATHAGSLVLQWFNADLNTSIGRALTISGLGQSGAVTYGYPELKVFYTPVADTRVELRLVSASGLSRVDVAQCDVLVV